MVLKPGFTHLLQHLISRKVESQIGFRHPVQTGFKLDGVITKVGQPPSLTLNIALMEITASPSMELNPGVLASTTESNITGLLPGMPTLTIAAKEDGGRYLLRNKSWVTRRFTRVQATGLIHAFPPSITEILPTTGICLIKGIGEKIPRMQSRKTVITIIEITDLEQALSLSKL